MLVLHAQQMSLLRSNSITRMLCESAQRSTKGKKIWLSMDPRNLGSYKVVRPYVRPPVHVSECEMSHLLAWSPSDFSSIQSVLHLKIVMVN